MRKIRVDFVDFAFNWSKTNNWLYRTLTRWFDIELCDQPEFLFYSSWGHVHCLHSGVRVFFTGESDLPDYRQCDYSISCRRVEDSRHLQLPYYVVYGPPEPLVKQQDDAATLFAAKSKFCAFVVTNHTPGKNDNRVRLFELLSRHRRVDSGGRFLNNIGGPVPGGSAGKIAFLRDYKFNICFENGSYPGYTTEKIYEAMAARSLPLYWGNPEIAREFNPRSFLDAAAFPSLDALADRVVGLDRDDAQYIEVLRQPYFHADRPNEFFDPDRLRSFFERVFETPITPVGRRRSWFLPGRWRLAKRHHLHPLRDWQGLERG